LDRWSADISEPVAVLNHLRGLNRDFSVNMYLYGACGRG
jgi:hypothetical protein